MSAWCCLRCAGAQLFVVSRASVLLGLLQTTRPRQWFKNIFVLAPIVFAKNLFHAEVLLRALAAFFVFSFLAGAVYTLNDLVDVEADRKHPTKQNRPIASGRVTVRAAKLCFASLVLLSLVGSFALAVGVGVCAVAYLLNNIAYSFRLKHVSYIDVSSLALGFVLRVIAGCFAVSTPGHPVRPSFYLIACTAVLALFLGFGKRRHELKVNQAKSRAALESYNSKTLDLLLYSLGALSVGVYLAYTLDAATVAFFHTQHLWGTTVFVLVGVGLFLNIVRDETRLDSPTDEMLKNAPFMVNLLLYAVVVIAVVYKLRPGL